MPNRISSWPRPLTCPELIQIRIQLDEYFNNTFAKPFKWNYKG
jgi:hypothetical protein